MTNREERRLKAYQRGYYKQAEARKSFAVRLMHQYKPLGNTSTLHVNPSQKVTLRFMRKGLFPNRVKARFKPKKGQSLLVQGLKIRYEVEQVEPLSHKYTKIEEDHVLRHEDFGGNRLKTFKLVATTLNEGFLYLIEEGKKHALLEYRVNECGELFPVPWSGPRIENGEYSEGRTSAKTVTREIHVPVDSKFHITYSRNQWTSEKVNAVLKGDVTAREELTLVDCGNYPKFPDGEFHNCVPYDNVIGQFTTAAQREYGEYIKGVIRRISVGEMSDGATPFKEDMFLILDDYVGCALDVEEEVRYQTNYLRATVESIKRGENVDSIKTKIDRDEILDAPKGLHLEISRMVTLAQTVYGMIFSKKNREGHFRDLLNESRLKLILGVKKRKELRDRLHLCRRDLWRVTLMDELKKEITINHSWTDLHTVDFEWIKNLLISTFLASDPYYIDSSLGNPDNYDERIEPDSFGDDRIVNLFLEPIPVPTNSLYSKLETGADWTKKIYGIADLYLKSTTILVERKIPIRSTYRIEETLDTLVTRLNGLGFGGDKGRFIVQTNRMEIVVENSRSVGSPLTPNNLQYNQSIATTENKKMNIVVHQDKAKTQTHLHSTRTVTVEGIQWEDTLQKEHSQGLERFPALKRLGVLLNIMNFGIASRKLWSDTDWKSMANVGAAAIDIGGDIAALMEAKAVLAKRVSEGSWKSFGKGLSIVGAVAGFGLSVHDAIQSYEKRDHDTAAAQGGSALAFGISAATFHMGAGTALLGLGPFGWAAIGIGLVLVSIFTADSKLEHYFKNIAFSNHNRFTALPKNPLPWKINRKIYSDRNRYDNSDDHQWTDFQKALIDLIDMVVVPEIRLSPVTLVNQKTQNTVGWVPRSIFDVSKFKLVIGVIQFLYAKEQLELHAYFCKDGIGSGNSYEHLETVIFETSFFPADKDNPPRVEARFSIPEEVVKQYKKNSMIVVLGRLKLGPDKYYPYSRKGNQRKPLKGNERWIGVYSFCKDLEFTEEEKGNYHVYDPYDMTSKSRIDTAKNLKSKKEW